MLKINHLSYWEFNTYFSELDYLIVGAGIVGSSTALHLRKKYPNAKILVIEKGYLPSGASTKNAGFSCFGSVTELMDDLEKTPENEVWETVEKRWRGLCYLRQLIGDKNLDYKQKGSWELIGENEIETYESCLCKIEEFNQKIKEITNESKVYFEDSTISKKFGFNQVKTSFKNKLEGQIDTGKMMSKFHQLLIESNIHMLSGIELLNIQSNSQNVAVELNIGELNVKNVIVCVNGFAKKLLPNEDVQPARAQVLITKPIENLQIEGTFHYHKGYYYFRNIHSRILLGGGRNLDFIGETTTNLGHSEVIMNRLNSILSEVILPNTPFEIDRQWAGIMGVGKTKKPIVKKLEHNVAIGVRLGGMGVAIGSLVGQELADLF
jgi:gamma-glutamylputrescine oxidase